jgi:hypothetical protein
MQAVQTRWTKQFTLTQIVSLALALAIVVSSVTAVATLAITGDRPEQLGGASGAPLVAVRATQQAQAQQFYARKEARQEAHEQLRAALTARADQQETMRRYYERKEAQMDALP